MGNQLEIGVKSEVNDCMEQQNTLRTGSKMNQDEHVLSTSSE